MTLRDITVVEITSGATADVGRMLADTGAHVLLVDPVELATSEGRRSFRRLIEQADVLLEAEPPGRLADLGLDYSDLTRLSPDTGEPDRTPGPPAVNAGLIQVSITPFGRTSRGPMSTTSHSQPMSDDTIRARAGWLDESGSPTVTANPTAVAARMATMATLVALMARERHGSQFVDVSILAAANVCAGPGTVEWLSNGSPLSVTDSMRP